MDVDNSVVMARGKGGQRLRRAKGRKMGTLVIVSTINIKIKKRKKILWS